MRNTLKVILITFWTFQTIVLNLYSPPFSYAQTVSVPCDAGLTADFENPVYMSDPFDTQQTQKTIRITSVGNLPEGYTYHIYMGVSGLSNMVTTQANQKTLNFNVTIDTWLDRDIVLRRTPPEGGLPQVVCNFGKMKVINQNPESTTCSIDDISPAYLGGNINVSIGDLLPNTSYNIELNYTGTVKGTDDIDKTSTSQGTGSVSFSGFDRTGTAEIIVSGDAGTCSKRFEIYETEEVAENAKENKFIKGGLEVNVCQHVSLNNDKCVECRDKGGVWTGLGCIGTGVGSFTQDLFRVAIGLGGGIAFLMLIYGAFLMVTSSGDPKATDNAKGIITGAISGLLVIIFSAVILQIVGIEILQIPGFAP